jgi:hypothetical protein
VDQGRQASAFWRAAPRKTEKAAASIIKRFCRGDRDGFALDVLPLEDGRFDIGHGGQPYVPLLVATVPLDLLVTMTLLLAQHLSLRAERVSS